MTELTATNELVGNFDEKSYEDFISLQSTMANISQRIGILEFQKYELLKTLESSSQKANEIMSREAYRLGIPDGKEWHVTKDREVFLGRSPELK